MSNFMVDDRDNSFPFDFELNGIPFESKSKKKLSSRSYSIQFERNRKYIFLSEDKKNITMVTVIFEVIFK